MPVILERSANKNRPPAYAPPSRPAPGAEWELFRESLPEFLLRFFPLTRPK